VPVERPSTSFGPNATVHFGVSIPNPGEYTIEAEVQVRGDNGSDTSDLYPLTVAESGSSTPEDGDDRGAGIIPDPGGGDVAEDLAEDPLGTALDSPAISVGVVLVVLVLLSSYADLAASLAGD
jgi:hypothetical protein